MRRARAGGLPRLGLAGAGAGGGAGRLRRPGGRAANRGACCARTCCWPQPDRRPGGQRRGPPPLRRGRDGDLSRAGSRRAALGAGRRGPLGRRRRPSRRCAKLARAARDPLERNELYIDLAAVEDEALAGQVLALALTDEAPTNFGAAPGARGGQRASGAGLAVHAGQPAGDHPQPGRAGPLDLRAAHRGGLQRPEAGGGTGRLRRQEHPARRPGRGADRARQHPQQRRHPGAAPAADQRLDRRPPGASARGPKRG